MDPSQYADLFLAESREHLSRCNALLLEWERAPQASEPVSGLFRSVHTIKGMAATMGYGDVAELAHRAENLLDPLRAGAIPGPEVMELLFRTVDGLEAAIEAAAGAAAPPALADLLAALDEAAAGYGVEALPRPSAGPPTPAAPSAAGRRVEVTLAADAPLKGARAVLLLRRLERRGRVYAVEPALIALEADDFGGRFAFRIDSELPDAALEDAIRAGGDVETVAIGATGDERTAEAGRSQHIRVDLRRLDALMSTVGELVTSRSRLVELAARRGDSELEGAALEISRLANRLQADVIEARMTPVWQVFDRFPRLMRDLARQLGKSIEFQIEGKEIELDRAILDGVGEPLVHLLRNAADHGVESPAERRAAGKPEQGRIVLSATRERTTVAIRVVDDGRGIDRHRILAGASAKGVLAGAPEEMSDEQLLRVLARPGFSTAAAVSDVSGRGVGIDVVATRVRALGGAVEIRTEPGVGTTFTLRVPTTLAIVRALIARVGTERYALPMTHVAETVDLDPRWVTRVDRDDAMTFRDQVVPLVRLRELLGAAGTPPARHPVVVLEIGERRSGLVVDQVLGQQEIVVKGFDPPRGTLPLFSGATVQSDGTPMLILDAGGLV